MKYRTRARGVVAALVLLATSAAARRTVSAGTARLAPQQDEVKRAFYGRRLEPTSAVLVGAGQSDETSFADMTQALKAKPPMLSMSYVDLHDDLPAFFARLSKELARYPTLVVPQVGLAMNAGDANKHYEQEVAKGVDDARLDQLCAGVKELDRPVFLRVGYEFNGPWNGYEPSSYVAAFRHVAAAMRRCSSKRIAVVWDWAPDAKKNYAAFYPGDEWVDWWALNIFDAHDMTSADTKEFLSQAEAHHFPVMIGEATPRGHSVAEGQRAIDGWYQPFFDLIRRSPGIKAFCYINWDWSKYPQWRDWGDGRVELNPVVLDFYRAEMAKPLYAGAMSRKATMQTLRSK